MTWKEFAKCVTLLLTPKETISKLGFKFKGNKYKIVSQWGSGDNREFVNLWAKKVGGKDKDRIYPFSAKQVDKLKFFKMKEV